MAFDSINGAICSVKWKNCTIKLKIYNFFFQKFKHIPPIRLNAANEPVNFRKQMKITKIDRKLAEFNFLILKAQWDFNGVYIYIGRKFSLQLLV